MLAESLKKIARGLLFSALAALASANPTVSLSSPARNVLAPGGNVNLSISATGSGALTYQWLHKGKVVVGATGTSLSIANATYADSGWYLVDVADSTGTTRSAPIFVTVAPAITQVRSWGFDTYGQLTVPPTVSHPVSIWAGSNVSFVVNADGTVVVWGAQNVPLAANMPAGLSDVITAIGGTSQSGSSHALVLRSNGTVVSWGANYAGQTNVPVGLDGVVAVAGGSAHSLALKSDGTVVAWGSNNYGQATVPNGLAGVVGIAAGDVHSLALKADGTVVAWGIFDGGAASNVPVGLSNVVAIAGGTYHSVALKSNGTVVVWGSNYFGQQNLPAGLVNVQAISVGTNQTLTLTGGGSLVGWGFANPGPLVPPTDISDVVDISAGSGVSFVLRDATHDAAPAITMQPTAQVVAVGHPVSFSVAATGPIPLSYQWRKNGATLNGQTGSTLSLDSVSLADAGAYDVVVTNHIGSITSAAANLTVNPNPVVTMQSATRQSLDFGQNLHLAVTATGNGPLQYQWTRNGRLLSGATVSTYDVTGVGPEDAGYYTVMVSDNYGMERSLPFFVMVSPASTQLNAWGDNSRGQTATPPGTANVAAISAGYRHVLALRKDGSVLAWGDDSHGQTDVPGGLAGVVAIAAGETHSLALKSDGTVVGWGGSPYNLDAANIPAGLTNVVAIGAGGGWSLALRSDGTVMAWGYNPSSPSTVPPGLTDVVAISAGGSHGLALTKDGAAVAWGSNYYSVGTVPAGLANLDLSTVEAGLTNSFVLKQDGSPSGWGGNDYGQLNVPVGLSGLLGISAGIGHVLALRADHTVAAWGANAYGQATVPDGLGGVVAISAGGEFSYALRDASGDVPPVITAQPASMTVLETRRALLSVSATGEGPLGYQWRKNGVNIIGATEANLVLTETAYSDAGNYDVIVYNHIGSVTSDVAVLIVNPIPRITSQSPVRQVVAAGQTVNLNVTATGTGPLSYQWSHNGRPIAGATSPALALSNLTRRDAGYYLVRITDNIGTRISEPIFLIAGADVGPAVTRIRGWGGAYGTQDPVPGDPGDAVSIASQWSYAYALRKNGNVVALGTYVNPAPSNLDGVVAIAAGDQHALALRNDGTVVAWGADQYGQTDVPVGLANVVSVACGSYHSMALKADGTVVAWGAKFSGGFSYLNNGQADVPAGLSGVVAIAATTLYSVALKKDGSIVAWGYPGDPVPADLASQTEVAGLANGANHLLMLKRDGTVVAWGTNSFGQTDVPAGLDSVIALAGGSGHSLALKSDGTVVAWGDNYDGQTAIPEGLPGVIALAAGSAFSLALCDATEDGLPTLTALGDVTVVENQPVTWTVTATGAGPFSYQWRKNGAAIVGATTATLTLPHVLPIDAGNYDVVVTNYKGATASDVGALTVRPLPVVTAISASRQVFAPGQNLSLSVTATGTGPLTYQWLRNGRAIFGATASSYSAANLSLSESGWYVVDITDGNGTRRSQPIFVTVAPVTTKVVGWGFTNNAATAVSTPANDIVAVSAGGDRSLALRRTGAVLGFGGTYDGESAILAGLSEVVAVEVGASFSMALKSDGTIAAWGNNNYGQTSVPADLNGVVAVAAGSYHALALKSDGTVVAWGKNSWGQTTVPMNLTDVVAIAAGEEHSLAVKSDGTVLAWGANYSGQCDMPTGLADVIAVTAGSGHSLALRKDGTVVGWGDNSWWQATVPEGSNSNVLAVAAGFQYSYLLKRDGAPYGWGSNVGYVTTTPNGLSGVYALSSKSSFTLALVGQSAPAIFVQPESITQKEQQAVTLSVAATGLGPISYQWRKNGADIPGATTATLMFDEVTPADAGSYDVVATNSLGTATSRPATIEVVPVPVVTGMSPRRNVVAPGEALTMNLTATGTGTLSYQWFHRGTPVIGATLPEYAVANASKADAGWYQVEVTDANGTRRSPAFFVQVAPRRTRLVTWGALAPGSALPPADLSDAIMTAGGASHHLILRRNGTVLAMGVAPNPGTELGVLATLTDVVTVDEGDGGFSLALKSDGTVVAWGLNEVGQTNVPPGLKDVVAISAGGRHGMALKGDGTVVCWGYDANGQLATPQGLKGVVGITAGAYQSLAIKHDGTVTGWGSDATYSVGVPPLSNVISANAAGSNWVALRGDGTLEVWGYSLFGSITPPAGLSQIVAVAAGPNHSLALLSDGHVVGWGADNVGQATPPSTLEKVFSIAAGGSLSVALVDATPTNDFSFGATTFPGSATEGSSESFTCTVTNTGAQSWGPNHSLALRDSTGNNVAVASLNGVKPGESISVNFSFTAPTVVGRINYTIQASEDGVGWFGVPQILTLTVNPLPGSGFVKISAGRYHSLRLDSLSRAFATGTNTYGQLGDGTTTNTATPVPITIANQIIAAMAAGGQHSLILTGAKELWASGYNGTGQLGDGTLVAKSTPFKLATNIAGMAAAVFHSAYLKTDGTLWTVGGNDSGQLGDGTTTDRSTPVQVATGVIDVALGNRQSFYLKSDGTLWGMGDMNGSGAPVSTPVQVATNVQAMAAGAYHSLILKTDGTLWTMGYNSYGQLGNGTTTNSSTPVQVATGVTAIAAGYFHSAFLKADHTLWMMGYNSSGQLGDGTTTNRPTPFQLTTNVAAVSASEAYTLYTKADGSLWGMGYNAYGQFGNGDTATTTTPVQISTGIVLAPATPTGLNAGTVAALDRVHLTWQPAADAGSYEVWRNTTNDPNTATLLAAGLRWGIYEDVTAANGQAYYYWIKAVNPAGTSAFSTPVAASTSGSVVAPSITTPPQSQTINADTNVTFSVIADGTAPLSYQWRKGGVNLSDGGSISGATSATLTITGAQTADAGSYDVVVSNSAGSVTSDATSLAVPPALTAQTQWQKVFVGNNATFSVTANGATGYQWERSTDGGANWAALSDSGSFAGAITATLTVSGTNAGMSGWRFRAVVSGAGGNVTTAPATLTTISTTPSILWGGLSGAPRLLPVFQPKAVGGGVASVAAGGAHTMFIKTDGTLWATGNNQYGQFGTGTTSANPQSTPVQVASDVVSVSAGMEYSVFLKTDGTLMGMGSNTPGILSGFPMTVATNVASAAAGSAHAMLVKTDGTLWAMGANIWGQLGDGTTTDRYTPVQVATGVASVAAGGSHTVFVKSDGTLWAMGSNHYGELGDGTTTDRSTPVQIATGVMSVAAGSDHTVFVKTDGTLWAVGSNYYGELGDGTTTDRSTPVQIATGVASVTAGGLHTMFVKTDGSLWAMGHNVDGELGDGTTTDRSTPVQIATGVASVATGGSHTAFVKTDSTLWAHGSNEWGQLGDHQAAPQTPPIATGVMTAGADSPTNNLFVKSDGTLWQHVQGQVSQVAGVSGVVQAIIGNFHSRRLYLKGDGTLWLLAQDGTSSQVARGVVSAGAGINYTAYLQSDGSLWGQGADGTFIQFGDGTAPVQIADHVVSLSTGAWHLLFTKDDQTLWGMGTVWSGFAPGSGWTQYVSAPGQLETGVVSAAGGLNQNLFLKTDGTLWTRGSGWADAAGPAAQVDSDVLSAAIGLNCSLYLKADGILRSRAGVQGTLGAITQLAENVGSLSGGSSDSTGWYMYLQPPGSGTAPAIITQPQTATLATGTTMTLQVAATGTAPMAYQWFKDGVAVPWAQAAQYPIPYATATDAGSYTVTITNSAGTITSDVVLLALAPAILTHPQTQSADVGASVTFAVVANGTPAPTYQWRKDSVDIGGATGSSLTLSNLQLSDAGSYTVVVTSVAGSVTSNSAVLSVSATYNSWQQSKFTAGELANANISGPNAVYGQDGLPNLVKYALGLEPKQNVTTGLPAVSTTATDWIYTYTRPSDRTDVTYEVEVSTNLTSWGTGGVTHELVSSSGGTETWHARYPLASAVNCYFRLKVTQ